MSSVKPNIAQSLLDLKIVATRPTFDNKKPAKVKNYSTF